MAFGVADVETLRAEISRLQMALAEAERLRDAAWEDWDSKREAFEGYKHEADQASAYQQKQLAAYDELAVQFEEYRTAAAADERNRIEKRDLVYRERDTCVAVLARLARSQGWPCGLGKHDEDDENWDREWLNIVFIELPVNGKLVQCSWHIREDELPLFAHLPPYTEPWDGHTTEQKYAALRHFAQGLTGHP